MISPYHHLLRLVVDRLRSSSDIVGPPAIQVFAEEEEAVPGRPGYGENIYERMLSALERSGAVIIVYIDSVSVTENHADRADIRVQVIEHVVKNRHHSGSGKGSVTLMCAVRNCLENYRATDHPEWTPLRWSGWQTIDKSLELTREASITSMSLVPFNIQS